MFFQLPPTLPPAATVSMVEIMAECKKGSRDCFPEDRVGVTVKTTKTTVLDLRTEAITAVFHREVNT
ncbi:MULTISPECIES: hypothetical protein [Cyanophyceae]|uniref:hypothetical protein n=1 Tax=Cyanophyceae TaxID=3028117 RepID=UPI0016860C2D|nr:MULTISPECIES: hypothetical protein [Cyanophyceae]MBD1917768.1 hypothetical protein [Phormidium sp. FACHB-77]MBD2032887.1 hypothetical protein [Phormidium sp. FACHB-322]MBD2051634.1 hypothetical protein [Leptolyngbya sp. FACHB-60]